MLHNLLLLSFTELYVSALLSLQQHSSDTNTSLKFLLLYLYRARNKITQLSIPTHAQLQRHRLKFIKNHLKNSYMFRSSTIFGEMSSLKSLLLLATVGCFYAKSGDLAACRVVCIGLYLKSA